MQEGDLGWTQLETLQITFRHCILVLALSIVVVARDCSGMPVRYNRCTESEFTAIHQTHQATGI